MHVEINNGEELKDVPVSVQSLKIWEVNDEHIVGFSRFESLEHLEIMGDYTDPAWGARDCFLHDPSIEEIAKLPNLKTLEAIS